LGFLSKFFNTKETNVATQHRNITSSENFPEKIFIERDGLYHEWSTEEPASLHHNLHSLLHGFYGSQNFIELFYSLPEVFAPVHEIAKRVSDANWQLRKEWNDEVDYKDEDFNRLFTKPNPLVSHKDLVYQAVCYEILTGKQLFFFNQPDTLIDEYKSIITWSNLPAHKVTVDLKKNVDPYTATELSDFVNEYRLPIGNGRERKFPVNKVLPICHLSLNSGWDLNDCKSLLLGAEKAIRNLIPVYEARGTIYIKRGALGFLVGNKTDASGHVPLSPKEKAEVLQDFHGTYGITPGKSPVGITRQPLQWVQTAMSIKELEPFNETLADAAAIYAVLRVPPHLIPSKDKSTFANADADMKAFYTNVIIPWAKRYAESWTNYMKLTNYRRYIFPDYSHIEVLQENQKEKADVQKVVTDTKIQQFLNGACSLNEFIIAIDGTPGTDPIYSLKWLDMDDEQRELVSNMLRMKMPPAETDEDKEEGKVTPLKKVV
jgi:hypothetical protein